MDVSPLAGNGRLLPSIFVGYDMVTLLVVANLAFSGLLVSWVMKFADSIMKVHARFSPVPTMSARF